MNDSDEKLAEPPEQVEKSKRKRRQHQCLYCNVKVGNFYRHLERHHFDEFEVQEIMSMDKKSLERKHKIDKIRREGDFCSAEVVPVSARDESSAENYLPCIFCRGYYNRISLRRHVKKCPFNPDPSKRYKPQSSGQTFMSRPFGPNDPLRSSGVLDMLRADEVSMIIKKDPVICEVGRRYIKSHKQQHLRLVAKRSMRRLARLLLATRKMEYNNQLTMEDILIPSKFKLLIAATKNIAEYDVTNKCFGSPFLALQMGTLIKSAINTCYSIEVQKVKSSKFKLEQLNSMRSLIESDWCQEISSEAAQNLEINKFNKPSLIPMASDIKKFEVYLNNLLDTSKDILTENMENEKAFRDLLEGIFCSVLLFNRRRVGELERMPLDTFLQNIEKTGSSEFEKALTETEKILFNSLKRVVIRGKRGRGVPVLFEKSILTYIDLFLKLRSHFDLQKNVYFFGVPGTQNPIAGYKTMRKHAKLALNGEDKATLLMSTKLRKHLATLTQIYKMDKEDLQQLATFMGHTEKTHSEFYRLPDEVYQTAKVSKLLLLSKKINESYSGKRLQDIDINTDFLEEDNNGSSSELDEEEVQENTRNNSEDENEPEPDRVVNKKKTTKKKGYSSHGVPKKKN